jgi:Cu2+-exporting ATPase
MPDSSAPTLPVHAGAVHASDACQRAQCTHCGNTLTDAVSDGFCCSGCRTVYGLLHSAGLLRYYDLRGDVITEPIGAGTTSRRDQNWLEPLCVRLGAADQPIELAIKLQGMRCAACVWLIQELFARNAGAHRIVVNSGRGSASLCVDRRFPLAGFVSELASFGYLAGEDAGEAAADGSLLLRTGVCLALGMNAMMFAAAIYLGLREGPLYRVLHALNFACATLAVLIGAPVFMRSAWQALKRGILHLDLPIAVGIALSYVAALWSFTSGHAGAAYYDSLAAFIALMLLGRWLKERIVLANQKQLLADDGVERILVRRIEAGTVQLRPAGEIRSADELLVSPGDLVPVAAELLSGDAACSLDWITGESEPTTFARGEVVPAGAFNAQMSPLRVRARSDFGASDLVALLGRRQAREMPLTTRGNRFALAYVIGVLLTAAGAFAGWWWLSGSVTRALEVATAICVVTCPCAIGIATPLAEDLVLSGLRRAGLFVRSGSFLDRALSIRRIVFDKTGTLTTGRLHVQDSAPLEHLRSTDRDLLYTLACASLHPKSAAVASALQSLGARLVPSAQPAEIMGRGVELASSAGRYRFGHSRWVLGRDTAADLVFARDETPLCELQTAETPRPGAAREIAALRADGYDTWILSGDAPARVAEMARELGVAEGAALGGFSPQAKAEWIAQHDHADSLMIGDGINDSLAVERAFTSGTPAIDRAFMPWRSDFYFVTAGLAPIRLALRAARRLARVVRRNQRFALVYNAGVVALAIAGAMRPWLAAVLMPASSIVVVTATSLSLSARSRLWKS